MNRVIKTLLYAAITFFTIYVASYIVQYGLMMLMCVILIAVGSLLFIHVDGASAREVLWSMSRRERQLFHAKNLQFFSVIPLPDRSSQPIQDGANTPRFRPWNEWQWRKLADSASEQWSRDTAVGKPFVREVDNCLVRSGWPAVEEVERCDNTIVLSVRGLWAGLAARINPVLNAFLNRYVKCWNRSLMFCGIRLSAYGLPYPCVAIDFPTADVATLNFGQKDDFLVLSYIYEKVRQTYPKAKIIIVSVCLGGLRVLNWLNRNPNPENLIGVVLESPLPSVKHLLQGFLGSWYSNDLYNTFCLVVPNYRPELEGEYSFLRDIKRRDGKIPNEQICRVPIFIGIIETDPFSNRSHLPLFCGRFPNLTVFSTDEREAGEHKISHGKLYRLPSFQLAAQTFITAIQLAHSIKPHSKHIDA